MTSHEPETPPDVPGYEMTRLIGVGGMGEVYLAVQQMLNRPVAIKFLTRSAAGLANEAEQRFRREAEVMARLSHPNIMMIFDFGTACGRPYLVMEYVKTGDLRSKMAAGLAMDLADVRAILGPVIRAVSYLHSQGIIHRDIKPENILIHQGIPRVTDFGIALLDSVPGSLTRTGVSLGTPGYVAPEQQYRLKVDERVDQFSLASLAYELVTGRKPLGVFPPPTKLNPKLSRLAEAAILKGLSDDPTDRFTNVEEFGEALDRGLASSPRGLFRGRNAWLVAGSLIGSSFLGVGVLTLADHGRPSLAKNSAEQPSVEFKDRCPTPGPTPRTLVARSANLKLVLVDPGEFRMGSLLTDESGFPEERPSHLVKITRGFYLGETEVTIGQFQTFVDATRYRTSAERNGGGWQYSQKLKGWEQNARWTWRDPGGSKPPADREPVTQVSWDDANAFCEWLTLKEGRPFRLPTEAEWEYACRAGTQTQWSSGDAPETLDPFAWTLRNADFRFHEVGTRKPNAFGLYDMHGNAWEWCSNWISPYSKASEVDPKGSSKGQARILRGGSFDWDKVERTRSASRIAMAPEKCYLNYGFRVGSTAE
jgi:formylglycine-generating enzyme required for sulfatase activity